MTTANAANTVPCCSEENEALSPQMQAIRDFYDAAAAEMDPNYLAGTDKFSPSGPTQRIKDMVLSSSKVRILDIGCGMGTTLLELVDEHTRGLQFIGVDFSTQMIKRAKERAASLGDVLRRKVGFFTADAQELPYMDGQFDFVYSECVYNLVPDRQQALSEVYRVLAVGGVFVYTDFVAYRPVPDVIKNDLTLVSGCRAGSVPMSENMLALENLGFVDFKIENFTEDKNHRYQQMREENETYRQEYEDFKREKPESHQFLEDGIGYYLISAVKR
ncbi:putative arsinothricin biosynthesis methyltransferase ArsM [Deinococcus misasensis]|uniref:putative arsinothricin biosynthesis methyltransferase ArsM n=1 Tax=Deinococcus misasensis TaxID=392413 RepID=UPI000692277F|nr:putative arsinothricin biosynthesis methyltransferase ArsM [Deinococcus misasensis]